MARYAARIVRFGQKSSNSVKIGFRMKILTFEVMSRVSFSFYIDLDRSQRPKVGLEG